jgi:hypothetical protein
MRSLVLAFALSLVASLAHAEAGRRFEHSQITLGEWQMYLNEIKAKPGVETLTPQGRPETKAYFVSSERTVYYFTTGGPAYPAVVVTRLYERDGKLSLQNFGYFAGAEDAFADWFSSFNRLGPDIEARLKAK